MSASSEAPAACCYGPPPGRSPRGELERGWRAHEGCASIGWVDLGLATCCWPAYLPAHSLEVLTSIEYSCCEYNAGMDDLHPSSDRSDSPFGCKEAACEGPHTQDAEDYESNDTNGSVDAECRRQGLARDSCSSKETGRVPSAAAVAVGSRWCRNIGTGAGLLAQKLPTAAHACH